MEDLPAFFKRRFDHHKFEKTMRKNIHNSYYATGSYNDFKLSLLSTSLIRYFGEKYDISFVRVDDGDIENILKYLLEVYESLIKHYWLHARKG